MKLIKNIFQINAIDPFIIVVQNEVDPGDPTIVLGTTQGTINANELSKYLDLFLQQQRETFDPSFILVARATNADEITGYGIEPGTKAVTYSCETPAPPPLETFDVYLTNNTAENVPFSVIGLGLGLYMFKVPWPTTQSGTVINNYAPYCTFINYNVDGTTALGTRQLRQYINGNPMTSALVVTSGQAFDIRTIPGFIPNPNYATGNYISVE